MLTTVSITVKELTELLQQVKDEQSYIIVRERTHRNTAESTNARVKWWSIFQLGVLIGEGIFQVWWLKRFFEVCCRSSMRKSGWALTVCDVGEEGCLSANGYVELGLYVIEVFTHTSRRENQISQPTSQAILSFPLSFESASLRIADMVERQRTLFAAVDA